METQEIQPTIQAIIDALTPLAEKLQVPLGKMFEWAVRENYVQAITDIAYFAFFPLVAIGYFKLLRYLREKSNDYDFELIAAVIGIIGGIFLTIYGVALFFEIPIFIGRLVNPEYHALMDIMKMLSGGN